MESHYKKPTNSIASYIWEKCCLLDVELYSDIKAGLWRWIEDNGLIERSDASKENAQIQWTAPSGDRYKWTWTSLVKWMICCCGDPLQLRPPSPRISGPIRAPIPVPMFELFPENIDFNLFRVNLDE